MAKLDIKNTQICETEDRKVPLKYRLIPRRIKEKKLREFYARKVRDCKPES